MRRNNGQVLSLQYSQALPTVEHLSPLPSTSESTAPLLPRLLHLLDCTAHSTPACPARSNGPALGWTLKAGGVWECGWGSWTAFLLPLKGLTDFTSGSPFSFDLEPCSLSLSEWPHLPPGLQWPSLYAEDWSRAIFYLSHWNSMGILTYCTSSACPSRILPPSLSLLLFLSLCLSFSSIFLPSLPISCYSSIILFCLSISILFTKLLKNFS